MMTMPSQMLLRSMMLPVVLHTLLPQIMTVESEILTWRNFSLPRIFVSLGR
uniref:Putative WD repeat-containing protein C2A9.03 n=1 Tax=Rhizophora mucronata TaxID=61149 RepID=A0A2P2LD64_RHIMU